MGAYISLSSEIGRRALIGAWALKGMNTVTKTDLPLCCLHLRYMYRIHPFKRTGRLENC